MIEQGNRISLTILETSDIHGNIFPINYGNNREEPFGLGKIASLINKIRRTERNLLLIDNGDLIQGTPLTYHYVRFLREKPNPMVSALNFLNYDAAVIGNHEFNYGREVLNDAVSQSRFPWLSANIIDRYSNRPAFGTPYLIKKFASGLRVALLGLTTHYIPNWENPIHIKNLMFENALESAKHWVSFLHEKEKPDLLVVAYHGGFEHDMNTGESTEEETGENQAFRICHEVKGIDVLLTGHQHRRIASELNGVTVLQPGDSGKYLGKVTLSFVKRNGKWEVEKKSAELLSVENEAADQALLSSLLIYERETQKWLDKKIGSVEGEMIVNDPMNVRLKEHPLIEFINRVQMDAAGVDISVTALFHNGSPGFGRIVTMRDIISNYVYPNTLVVIKVSGRDIKAALERSASYFLLDEDGQIGVNPNFISPKPQHYNYDMWEGIEYEINVSRPIGERVTLLNYKGKPIDFNGQFDVVMNHYRAGGGGEYTMFKNRPIVKEIQTDMTELIANYFIKHKTIRATVNHNWRVFAGR